MTEENHTDMKQHEESLMEKIVSLAKRRGFIFPGSEIYGGLQNSWDYGPLGVELKRNIKDEWWHCFVTGRGDMVGLDGALIMNPKVWEASGHLKNFSDPLVECRSCRRRFRADHLEGSSCPDCGGEVSEARQFNLMLKTFLGPEEEKASEVYLRPETAQAIFVNFKNVLDTIDKQLLHEPTRQTRNRKILVSLIPPWEHVPPVWELRIGEYRVFYDVDEETSTVTIRAVRYKPPHMTTEEIL